MARYTRPNSPPFPTNEVLQATVLDLSPKKGDLVVQGSSLQVCVTDGTWKQVQLSPSAVLTSGSVPFVNEDGTLTQDNTKFFYDGNNHRLAVGGNTPTVTLDITGAILSSTSVTGATLVGNTSVTSPLLAAITGTAVATGLLFSSSDIASTGLAIFNQSNGSADSFDLIFRKSRGTGLAPTVITTADEFGTIQFSGWGGAAGYIVGAAIKGISAGTIADSRVPGFLSFWTGTDAAPSVLTERVRIYPSGGMFIGAATVDPGINNLQVQGDIVIGKTAVGSQISLITPDTTVKPFGKFRANSDQTYGVDFDQEEQGVGYFAIFSVRAGVRTRGLVQSWSAGGNANIGIKTSGDPASPLSVAGTTGSFQVNSNGIISSYNAISTVSNGIPSELATVDSTVLGAAVAATTIYAVPASGAGMYRISFVAKITQTATTSSVLGGTAGFQLIYTDQNDSVVVTTGFITNISGAILTGNTTQIVYAGSMVVNAKLSTNIRYSIDYTSVGAQPMQYNLHIKVEAL